MNCTEFNRRLHAAVEQRDADRLAPLRNHAAECSTCFDEWEAYELLARAVPAWKCDVPQVDLTDAVLANFNPPFASNNSSTPPMRQPQRSQRTAARSKQPGLAVVGVAAVVLLLALSLMHRQNAHVAPIAQTPADPPQRQIVAADAEPVEAELDLLLRDAGTAYLQLARGAADALTEVSTLVPAGTYASRDSQAPEPGVDRSLLDRWQDELRPVGAGFGRAIDFLLDAVPADAPPTT